MSSSVMVSVGGVTFESAPVDESGAASGFGIVKGGLTGWWGRPSARGESVPKSDDHGDFDLPTKLGPRVVSLVGRILPPDVDHLGAMRRRLSAIGADGSRLTVTVEDRGLSTWSWCRVIDCEVEQDTTSSTPRFQLLLRLSDPRHYGELQESVSTGAAASAFHRGNFVARPGFRVSGSMNGYRLESRGRSFVVPGSPRSGEADVVDFASATVLRGGALVQGTIPDAWDVPAGEVVSWRLVPASGSGSAQMLTPDTFI